MAMALENRPEGRPILAIDQEKEALRDRNRELEKHLYLAEKTIEVKELLAAYEGFRDKDTKNNQKIGKAIGGVVGIVEVMQEQPQALRRGRPLPVPLSQIHGQCSMDFRWLS